MSIYHDSNYEEIGKFGFPKTDIDPKEKDKPAYNLAWCQSIYSLHIRNKSGIPYSELANWEEQRAYGQGLQDKDKYIPKIKNEGIPENKTYQDITGTTVNALEERRKGWKNINDQIISVAPKIKDAFHGMFDDMDYDIDIDTIDQDSGAIKDRMKYHLLAQTLFAKEYARLRAIGNIPEEKKDFLPKDITELDAYEAAGGFKLNIAKEMEKLLKHTFDISEWDTTIAHKLIDDALDVGYIATKKEYDAEIYKTKTKYVDVSRLTMQYSEEDNYDNSDWAGYYNPYTISQLENEGFTRTELEELAYEYSGELGNPSIDIHNDAWREKNEHGYYYDSFKIPVYEVEWIDRDITKYLQWTTKQGKERIKKTDFDTNEERLRKKTLINHSSRIVRKAKWIIGTKKVFDYGLAHDHTRPLPSKPILSYRMVKVTSNPIMRRLIPIFDKMQLAWLRYQNAIIMSASGGFAVNVRLMNNIVLGKQKLTFKKVWEIFRNNSLLFYSDTPPHGIYQGGGVNPVTPLPSMLKDEINNAIQEFEYSIKQIEHITGLTPVALGGTPEERAGKATTEISFSATQNVMRPIVQSIMRLKEKAAESAMLHILVLIKHNKKSFDAYADVIGKMGVMALKSSEYRGTRYGIKMRAKPTQDQWAEIYALLQEAMSLGRDGVKSIELDDALWVYEKRDSGANLTEMRLQLSYKIRKYKEEKQRQALQTQQAQQQGAMQLDKQKAQEEIISKQNDHNLKMKENQQKHDYDMQIERFKANQEFKRLVFEKAAEEEAYEKTQNIPKNE